MSGDHHSHEAANPELRARPRASSVQTKRIWWALGLLVGGVRLISTFADFPTVIRLMARAGLSVMQCLSSRASTSIGGEWCSSPRAGGLLSTRRVWRCVPRPWPA